MFVDGGDGVGGDIAGFVVQILEPLDGIRADIEYLAGGLSEAEILADFPDLSLEDIRAALAFAAERERRLFSAL